MNKSLTWQLGSDQMDKSIASGSQMVDQWSSLPKSQSQVVGENLTAGEITNLMKQQGPDGKPKLDPTKATAFPTGKKYVGEDAQGKPQYALTYTLMSVPAEYQLSPDDKSWVDVVNQIPGGQKYNVGEKEGEGDRMPGYVANSLFKQVRQFLLRLRLEIKRQQGKSLKMSTSISILPVSGQNILRLRRVMLVKL